MNICGPVHSRWMYPMEQYLKRLKGYIRQQAQPEESITKGYIMDEELGFCMEYMQECNLKHQQWIARDWRAKIDTGYYQQSWGHGFTSSFWWTRSLYSHTKSKHCWDMVCKVILEPVKKMWLIIVPRVVMTTIFCHHISIDDCMFLFKQQKGLVAI
jgi:hypothetical protein